MQSPIEEIFKEIYGYLPTKSGTAFERLASVASYLLDEGEVTHDAKLRGQFSDTLYQIDVHHRSTSGTTMGEAKDYSRSGEKVGREDLQKLGGALPDLKEIDSGAFFTATEFTLPAKKYAASAEKMFGKPIELWTLRPSTEVDQAGFVKTIIVQLNIIMPQPENGEWIAQLTNSGNQALKVMIEPGKDAALLQINLGFFYDGNGNVILQLCDLTSQGFGVINSETNKSHGCFILRNHHVNVNGIMAEINGLEYALPYTTIKQEIRITDDSNNRFVLIGKDGNIERVLTDQMLREFEFSETGKLTRKQVY